MADKFDDPLLHEWSQKGLHLQRADEWYARVNEMHERSEYYKGELIRSLRWVHGLTMEQAAEVTNSNLGSRQAVYAAWKRYINPDRRVAGSPGRGGWPKGKSRS